jgi:hypothetical protein
LCNTPLYKNEGVVINNEMERILNRNNESVAINLCTKEPPQSSHDDEDIEPISKRIIHGCKQHHLIDELDNKIIKIVSSKGFKPMRIF